MSDESKFDSKEIAEHVRKTTSRRRNVDYDRQKLMQDIVALAKRGEVDELQRKLGELGLNLTVEQRKAILKLAEQVRQEAQR